MSNYPDKQKIRSALTLRNIIWLIWKTIFLLGMLHLQINAYHFRQATGIRRIELETLYAGAHTDKDGYLIWKKIKGFQRSLEKIYGQVMQSRGYLRVNDVEIRDFAYSYII